MTHPHPKKSSGRWQRIYLLNVGSKTSPKYKVEIEIDYWWDVTVTIYRNGRHWLYLYPANNDRDCFASVRAAKRAIKRFAEETGLQIENKGE